MKKSLFIILIFILTFLFYLLFNDLSKANIIVFNDLFINKYLPCLLPFLILTNLLYKFINFEYLYILLKKKNLSLLFDIIIIFVCLINGVPGQYILLNHLQNKGIYSKEKVEDIINNYGIISLPFIYSITNKNILYIFLLISINTISYLLTKSKLTNYQVKDESLNKNITNKIFHSLSTIYLFSTSVVLLAIPLKLIFNCPLIFLLLGLIEQTFPIINLVICKYYYISYFLLNFTSFSLIYQIKKLNPSFSSINYIKKRLILASLTPLVYFIFS